MMRYLMSYILLAFLSACSTAEYHEGWFSEVKRGQKIRDLRPVPQDSTDLREFALSLPILEGRDEHSINWFYEMSSAAPLQQEWELPADGAQSPATIIRLPNHADGSQQIDVHQASIPAGIPMKSTSILARLKRIDSGWLVIEAEAKTKTY